MTTIDLLKEGKDYVFIDHTADIGFKVWGERVHVVFEKAALILFSVLYYKAGHPVQPRTTARLAVEGQDFEMLFVEFLNELLYLFYTKRFVAAQVTVECTARKLTAVMLGQFLPRKGFTAQEEIKSTTYHQLYIKKRAVNDYEAQVVFDV